MLFATFARALRPGELYIIETLRDHLENSNVPNRNVGERASSRYTLPDFSQQVAPKILRGIFKPRSKTFGFEVHEDHLDDMIRVMAADCQLNSPGHEIPYLLNRVDEEVKMRFKPQVIRDRIAVAMATQGEELFFEETDERVFR